MVNARDGMKQVHGVERAASQLDPAIKWLCAFEQVTVPPGSGGQDEYYLGKRCQWGECSLT